MEKVSVIIPVYNSEKYLKSCIESIRKQTYTDLEIILVDDGSTDKSGKICDEYMKMDTRIVAIHQENQGVSTARNNGLKAATGKYVRFIDSDDYIGADNIKNMVSAIIENGSDLAVQNLTFSYKNRRSDKLYLKSKSPCVGIDEYLEEMIWGFGITQTNALYSSSCNKMYRLDLIKNKNIIFNKNMLFNEDSMFNIEYLSMAEKICITSDSYYYRKDVSHSITSKYYNPIVYTKIYNKIYKSLIVLFKSRNSYEKNKDKFYDFYCRVIKLDCRNICDNREIKLRQKIKYLMKLRDSILISTKINDKAKNNILVYLIEKKSYLSIIIIFKILKIRIILNKYRNILIHV